MEKKKNYITPCGHKHLIKELENLNKIERPEIVSLVQWAASLGDRSENADYIYGKRRLREIDRRIRFLSQRLELAVIVESEKTNTNKIQFGATIKVIDDSGQTKAYTIVGIDEVNTLLGLISWQSPIGKSLLGKSLGEEVSIQVPAGEINLEIVEITYSIIEY
jgi:transcription elongation factor GreB